ncbi:hypothetical protein MNBD_ALPHA09-92 [hydrothermal vent metagenome]|uniref:Co-chaperone DjlA N-terminal domain-containing protein n=1 Tax=hydrothermal vent metagenome TaxID=652676 RepID=A0A3B0TGK4_9ZZZZ
MFDSLKSVVETLKAFGAEGAGEARNDAAKVRLAVASLLVRAATIDGHLDGSEASVLRDLLKSHYRLDEGESEALFADAREREAEAVDIYSFTRQIQTTLAREERQAIVRLMWQVAAADGVIDEFESNLVWRTAELIGISTRDRVFLRQEVLAEIEKNGVKESTQDG